MNVQRVDRSHARQTTALLAQLQVSLLGIDSRRLHTALVHDGVRGRIDCRIALESGQVEGVVLAAPASYWRSLPVTHWGIAIECIRARAVRKQPDREHSAARPIDPEALSRLQDGPPPRSWNDPGDAWRVIFVGTAADARGKGVAAQLYRSVMADRSLVARIALDNISSIRLHHSVGWRLYRDRGVALAVHLRDR